MSAETKELPLKGERGGTQKSIDNKQVLKSPPDPLVVEKAKDYCYALEKAEDAKDKASEKAQDLLVALGKSKRARNVKVATERRSYYLTAVHLTKLVAQKKEAATEVA